MYDALFYSLVLCSPTSYTYCVCPTTNSFSGELVWWQSILNKEIAKSSVQSSSCSFAQQTKRWAENSLYTIYYDRRILFWSLSLRLTSCAYRCRFVSFVHNHFHFKQFKTKANIKWVKAKRKWCLFCFPNLKSPYNGNSNHTTTEMVETESFFYLSF